MNEIKVSIITPLYKGTDYIPGLMAKHGMHWKTERNSSGI